MPPAEPSLAALPNPVLRYFLATRPPFLSVTLFAALIGLATAYLDTARIDLLVAAVTVLFALVAHAGANVLNDYYNAMNGTDAMNSERIFPFTGGSRFIQNGVLSPRATAIFGATLIAAVALAGAWLATVSAAGLVWIGTLGLLIGWGYSAPPLRLNGRGIGELCVWAGFALIAIGSDFVQRGSLDATPLVAVTGYALLVTNILYINQFPDRNADRAAGKHHWVVRLGPARARWGYVAIAAAAYGSVIVAVASASLPPLALAALLPAFLSARAARDLLRNADLPSRLGEPIRLTFAATSLHGFLLATALVAARAAS